MAQRDYEDQPEAPDLGAAVQLEPQETLTGPPGSDALDAGYVPPDRPYGLDDDATTAAGQRDGESHDERLDRERPEEPLPADADRSGRIAVPDADAVGEARDAMDGQDVGIDGGAASAEEAAVHDVDLGVTGVEDDSPMEDPAVAESLARDPEADTARVDAERDARATDAAEGAIGRDAAAAIDELAESSGTAAPASGRTDAGPGTGL
jgi:hypothetical protein